MISINEVFGKKNIKNVFDAMYKKSNNKKALDDFVSYYNLNKEILIKKISDKEYTPEIVYMKEIIGNSGKKRYVANLSIKDKVITRAISQIMDKYISKDFSKNSFAYQKQKGTLEAVKKIVQYINQGNTIVCKLDIENYFDNINHDKMISILDNLQIENSIKFLIEKYLKNEVEVDFNVYVKNKGIIQGNPLSALLSNIYLNDFDKFLDDKNINYIRYCDDINIFGKTKQEVIEIMNIIAEKLNYEFYLSLNKNKTKISNVFDTTFLGYNVVKGKDNIEIIKREWIPKKSYHSWHTTSLVRENNEYHIINDGILHQKEYNMLFENKEKKVYIPLETTNSINIYSNVIINSNFFLYANSKQVLVNLYDKNNRFIGKFIPANSRKSAIIILNQVKIYINEKSRLKLAKQILKACVHNILSNLKYYYRRHNINLKNQIDKIIDYNQKIKTIGNYQELLLLEARIRETYYSGFNMILNNSAFSFFQRTKRPPKDNINCLISFCNTLLYNYIAREIYKTTLDIRIAYLHASNNRYESLNLDIADIFKPVIVDRIIFKMINKNVINSNEHFRKMDEGVYLNDEGKKLVIKEFYDKILSNLKMNNKKTTYGEVIRNDIYKLMNAINYNENYKGFRYY